MGDPFRKSSAPPAAISWVPNVTMKAGTLPFATITPFMSPIIVPIKSVTATARTMGYGLSFWINEQPTIAENESTAPTERSIPPVMSTNVMPTARIPLIESCRSIFSRFALERKKSEDKLITANMTAKMTNTRYFTRKSSGLIFFIISLQSDACRRREDLFL